MASFSEAFLIGYLLGIATALLLLTLRALLAQLTTYATEQECRIVGPINPADNAGGPSSTGMSMAWAEHSAKRRAIRQAMQNTSLGRMKHGMMHAPQITHPRDGTSFMHTGSSPFGMGGGAKAGGF